MAVMTVDDKMPPLRGPLMLRRRQEDLSQPAERDLVL